MNPARLAAVRSLVSIRKSNRYANLELDSAIQKHNLSTRDTALFTTLVYGVIEREITLDHFLRLFCNRKKNALSPFLRATLHCAFYQLEYLSSIPARAVLFESAEIAKTSEKQSGAALVTGVLRAYLRAKEAGEDLIHSLNEAHKRSVRFSIPQWMLTLWDTAYGTERSDAIAASFFTPTHPTLYVNTTKADRKSVLALLCENAVKAYEHPLDEHLITLTSASGNLRNLPGYEEGLFFVQDFSSASTVRALDARPGECIADVCSAPGGKAFGTAIRMENRGKIYASDLHKNRISLISSGAARLGLDILEVSCRDAKIAPDELIGKMDRVLCDVPCSGLGVLRKKPDLRHKTQEEISSLPKIQSEILASSAKLVAPGGRLVYSTCTLNPAENEEVVQEFLRSTPAFQLLEPMRTLFPCDGDWDGFFYSVMEKRDS